MACLDTYNNSDHKGLCGAPMSSPRISFSNDFAEAASSQQQMIKHEIRSSRSEAPPGSSDFEFSVTNYSMMSADELFSKGRLLPFKNNCTNGDQFQGTTTLRDELLVDDDDGGVSLRPPKSGSASPRWKRLLGLKRTHIGSKKSDKNDGFVERVGDCKKLSGLVHEDSHVTMTSQEVLNAGGTSSRDVEMGI